MERRGYSRPRGGNAFDQYASAGRAVHPLEVDYKSLKIGSRIRLRFLDLTPEAAAVLEAREVAIINQQNNNVMAIKVEVPGEYDRADDGTYNFTIDPAAKDAVDHNGTPILACKAVKIYRAPVWVYQVQDENGKITTVDTLKFIEFTQGLRDSMSELTGFQNGAGAFNPETGRPDYDVDLCIVKGEGTIPKNYKFEVVFLDETTRKQHANFGPEAEDVLEGYMDDIQNLWDDVIDACFRQTTVEDFEKRIAVPKDKGQSVSQKPGLGRETPPASAPAQADASATPRPSTGGRKYGGRQ